MLLNCIRLCAQDVFVGDPVWNSEERAPEILPVSRNPIKPKYPEEFRKSDEIGYVLVHRFIDAKGMSRSLEARGTHLPFQRVVEAEFSVWSMSPARRAGQGVDAHIWIPIIFNPKSADAMATETKPRLLSVTPIVASVQQAGAAAVSLVRVRVGVNASGAITEIVPIDTTTEPVGRAIREALPQWRFAPARQKGQPVPGEAELSVICLQQSAQRKGSVAPAKLIKAVTPDYPIAMRRYGLRGQVIVGFIVNTSGKVQNPVVVESSNPAFDDAALIAVREWKFEPATLSGRPVAVNQRVPIIFQLQGLAAGGDSAYVIQKLGDQSKVPMEFRYDTPPKIRGVLVPVYPYALRRDGVRGKVQATALISPQGSVMAVKIRAADRPEFGLALTAALEGFTFDPALKNGAPVPHLLNFEQVFSASELPDEVADRLGALEKRYPEKIITSSSLDEPVKIVSRRSPLYPTGVPESTHAGSALVECVIDEVGHARLPRVVSATDPAFGYAAVQAVSAWWFAPPKSGGKDAVVRVQIPFDFKLSSEDSKDAPQRATP